jgi:hypothetical protein
LGFVLFWFYFISFKFYFGSRFGLEVRPLSRLFFEFYLGPPFFKPCFGAGFILGFILVLGFCCWFFALFVFVIYYCLKKKGGGGLSVFL